MADKLAAASTGSLELALARRLAHLHDGESVDPAAIDCDASFFAPTGFYIGTYVLDSLDIVEMIVALEVDFDIDIVMAHDVTQFDSIAKLSRLLEQVVRATELAAFESHWEDDMGMGVAEERMR
jgi:acyl carrier protein